MLDTSNSFVDVLSAQGVNTSIAKPEAAQTINRRRLQGKIWATLAMLGSFATQAQGQEPIPAPADYRQKPVPARPEKSEEQRRQERWEDLRLALKDTQDFLPRTNPDGTLKPQLSSIRKDVIRVFGMPFARYMPTDELPCRAEERKLERIVAIKIAARAANGLPDGDTLKMQAVQTLIDRVAQDDAEAYWAIKGLTETARDKALRQRLNSDYFIRVANHSSHLGIVYTCLRHVGEMDPERLLAFARNTPNPVAAFVIVECVDPQRLQSLADDPLCQQPSLQKHLRAQIDVHAARSANTASAEQK